MYHLVTGFPVVLLVALHSTIVFHCRRCIGLASGGAATDSIADVIVGRPQVAGWVIIDTLLPDISSGRRLIHSDRCEGGSLTARCSRYQFDTDGSYPLSQLQGPIFD